MSPVTFAFDDVDVSKTSGASQTLAAIVYNPCLEDLVITEAKLDDALQPFVIDGPDVFTVGSGESTDITVKFKPEDPGSYSGRLIITSNADDAQINFTGQGVVPVISVDRTAIDFGDTYFGCDAAEPVVISNVGGADLIVRSIYARTDSPEEFSVDLAETDNGALPIVVAPDQSAEVWLEYSPVDYADDKASLRIESSDPTNEQIKIPATGDGKYFGGRTDTYTQIDNLPVDVLFVLDRSASMSRTNGNLVKSIADLTYVMRSNDTDYHLAAVVSDDGCVLGPDGAIDSSFDRAQTLAAFKTMADVDYTLEPLGDNAKKGFEMAAAALSAKNIGPRGCNESFYRKEAFLVVIHVSDDADKSSESWGYYLAQLQALKAEADNVRVSAIAGDYPSGCTDAAAGIGYYEATVVTGGLFLTICNPVWSEHAENLATNSLSGRYRFSLTTDPLPDTVEVRIDGRQTRLGWSYDASTVAVLFEDDFVPGRGSVVKITYDKLPRCDD